MGVLVVSAICGFNIVIFSGMGLGAAAGAGRVFEEQG